MTEEVGVLIVDDHALFRRGVLQTINGEPDMTVVGEAATAAEAVDKAKALLPDVVLLDIKLPDRSGLSVTRTLQADCPYSKIIILTAVEDEDALITALKDGAHGYVLKGVSGEELLNVVRSVSRGETYVSPSIAGRLLAELTAPNHHGAGASQIAELTERERTILDLVAQGKTNKEIAAELFLTEKTVKHYVTNVLQKLQVRNRVEAALLATKRSAT